MLPTKVEYFTPKTIQEACYLALKHQGDAKITAGGTDLLVQMKHKEVLAKYIIDIKGIGQDHVTYDEAGGLKIGALVTLRSLETSPLIQERFSILAQAASKLGTWQVRNQGTIAGNLVNAAPSAETAPPLIVLGAKVKIMGADGERIIPLEDFL